MKPIFGFPGICDFGSLNATLEIVDAIYREAKAQAALTEWKRKDVDSEGLEPALLVQFGR